MVETGLTVGVHEAGVGDVVDARLDGPPDALGAVRVGGGVLAEAVGVLDEGAEFVGGELRVPGGGAGGHEAAGRHHLDDVDARLVVIPDRLADLGDRVDLAAGGPGVSSRGGELRSGGDDARTGDQPGADGVAQRDVGEVARAQRLHGGDAHRGELASDGDRRQGHPGLVVAVVGGRLRQHLGVRAEVGVRFDQAREDRPALMAGHRILGVRGR